jgi:o-succinylbenzoate synthase
VAPDAGRLVELTAPADRQRWWRERLVRCHAVLSAAAGWRP